MRINLIFLVGVISITAILLFTFIQDAQGSPSPKKRKGSSSSGSSSSGSSSTRWAGSKSSSSSGGKKWFGGGGYKPSKSGISKKSFSSGKKWKKALAFGAGAYIGAKVLKKVIGVILHIYSNYY